MPAISEFRAGLVFSEDYYLEQNPDVAAAVEAGDFDSAFDHFFIFGVSENRAPNAILDFLDEDAYLEARPDVAAAVEAGDFDSALDHFLIFGLNEFASLVETGIDLGLNFWDGEAYLEANQDVADAVAAGDFESALEHYILFGWAEDRAGVDLPTDLPDFDIVGSADLIDEGETLTFAVVSEDRSPLEVGTEVEVTLSGEAISDNDIEGELTRTGTITAGEIGTTFSFDISSDEVTEGLENLIATVTIGDQTVATADALINDTSLSPEITVEDVSQPESETTFTFTVTGGDGTYDYDVVTLGPDGTNPFDFAAGVNPSGTVTIEEGEGTINIEVADDEEIEADETFQLIITPEDSNVTLETATGTIENDDFLTVEDVSQAESETTFTFTVTGGDGTYDYDVVTLGPDGTNPFDFAAGVNPSGTLTIEEGEGTINIEVADDEEIEADETFQLIITPEDSDETLATATGTIEDDDGLPDVTVGDESQPESDTTFTFTLTGDDGIYEYDVVTLGPDGTNPFDFAAGVNPSGMVEVTGGTGEISFEVADDEEIEADETFQLIITPEDSDETLATATGTIENDDFAPDVTVGDVSQPESDTTFTFTVTTDPATDGTYEYDVVTLGPDGTDPFDFADEVNPSGTVEVTGGTGEISFEVEDDDVIEVDETFQLIITPEDSDETLATATGTIETDDVIEDTTFDIDDVSQPESDSPFEFDVTTSPGITGTLAYAVVATSTDPTIPDDFAGGNNPEGTFDIINGSGTVAIDVENDDIPELDDSFQLFVFPEGSEPESPEDALADAIGTIENDDGPIG